MGTNIYILYENFDEKACKDSEKRQAQRCTYFIRISMNRHDTVCAHVVARPGL